MTCSSKEPGLGYGLLAGAGNLGKAGWVLSAEQEQLIQRAIIDKRPEQMKLGFYAAEIRSSLKEMAQAMTGSFN